LLGSDVNDPVYGVILSRYPQLSLFECISSPQDWDVLYVVEPLITAALQPRSANNLLFTQAINLIGQAQLPQDFPGVLSEGGRTAV